jgi:hypothetical protein
MRRPSPPDDVLARALRSVLDEAPDAAGEHPSEAQVAAYVARELSAAEIEHLERHLATCASCTDELLAATAVEDEVRAQATRVADRAEVAASMASARTAAERSGGTRRDRADRAASIPGTAPRVKRRRSWLRIAASVTIVFGALAIAAAAGSRIVLGKLQPMLLDGMGGVLARKVSGGGTSIVLAGGPGLEMNDVAIAEDPQFGSGSFAQVRSAALHLDPSALLRGQVRGAVHFDEPVVHLLRDVQGRWNVESLSGKARAGMTGTTGAGATGAQVAHGGKERLVRLTSASVENGVLQISDRSGKGSDVTLRNVDLSYTSPDPRAAAAVTLAGTIGGETQRIAFSGEIGPFEGDQQPRYRFDEVALESLPLADIPGAPADLTGKLTFSGKLASSGSGFDTVMANASGDGAVGLCCGELRERNLSAELVAALTRQASGDPANGADVLAQARRSPALAATLSLHTTPFEDISGSVTIASGKVSFQDLAIDTPLFQASAAGSLSHVGAMDVAGTVALTPAATAAIVQLLPDARSVFGAATRLEVPFTVAGTWPNVRVKVDVRTALARLTRPLDPRGLLLLPVRAG